MLIETVSHSIRTIGIVHKSFRAVKTGYKVSSQLTYEFSKVPKPSVTEKSSFKQKCAPVLRALSYVEHFLAGRTFSRCLGLLGVGFLFASPAGPVFAGIVLGAVCMSMAIGIGFEIHKMRNLRALQEEQQLLEKSLNLQQKTQNILNNNKGISFLSSYAKSTAERPKHQGQTPVYKASWLRSAGKAMRDGIESFVAVGVAFMTFNIPVLVTTVVNASLGTVSNILDRKQDDNKKSLTKTKVAQLKAQYVETIGQECASPKELKKHLYDLKIEHKALQLLTSQIDPQLQFLLKKGSRTLEGQQLLEEKFLEIKTTLCAKHPYQDPSKTLFTKIMNLGKDTLIVLKKGLIYSPPKENNDTQTPEKDTLPAAATRLDANKSPALNPQEERAGFIPMVEKTTPKERPRGHILILSNKKPKTNFSLECVRESMSPELYRHSKLMSPGKNNIPSLEENGISSSSGLSH